jgi:hypothetical protein
MTRSGHANNLDIVYIHPFKHPSKKKRFLG